MRVCVNCKHELQANQIIYNVSDLDADVLEIVEETIGREAKVHDSLCSYCFSTIIHSQEEEEETVEEAETEDPLLEPTEILVVKKHATSSEEEEEVEIEEQELESVLKKSAAETVESEEDEDSDDASSSSEYDPGPVVNLQSKTCVVCSEEFNVKRLVSLPLGPERDAVEKHIYPKKLSRHSVICKDCLQKTLEVNEEHPITPSSIDIPQTTPNNQGTESTESTFIYVPNYYMMAGRKKCFVRNCQNDESRKVVPRYMRRILLENYNIYLTPAATSCTEHRKEYYRDWSHLKDEKLSMQKFNGQQIEDMLETLRNDQ